MAIDLSLFSDTEIIALYGDVIQELRNRKVVRSKNIVGDLGERIAIEIYNSTPGLPNLQAAPLGTQNVDALSRNGDRYTIKTTTSNGTGVFWGLPPKGSEEEPIQRFEYVIVVRLDNAYKVKFVLELTWKQFIEHKRWHSRMKAWNISLNKEVIEAGKKIYMAST